MTLKLKSRSTKYNQCFTSTSYKYVQVWLKLIHLFERYGSDKAFLTFFDLMRPWKLGHGHQNTISALFYLPAVNMFKFG